MSESEGEQKDQRQPEVRGEEKYGFSQRAKNNKEMVVHPDLFSNWIYLGMKKDLPAHLPDTRQLSRATPACSSA